MTRRCETRRDVDYHHLHSGITLLRRQAKRLAVVCGSRARVSVTLRENPECSHFQGSVKKLAGEFRIGHTAALASRRTPHRGTRIRRLLARARSGDRIRVRFDRPWRRGGGLAALGAGQLQPVLRSQRRRRPDRAPDPGQARARQPDERHARTGAGRELDDVGRSDLHRQAETERQVLGWTALHVERRRVLARRRLRRPREPACVRDAGGEQTAEGGCGGR